MVGLHAKEPKKPQKPNQLPSAIEQEILAYVARYPADGPKRIYYELKAEDIQLGESGLYNVLDAIISRKGNADRIFKKQSHAFLNKR